MHRALQVEMPGQRDHVGGIGLHVVAAIGLAAAAVTAAVMGDDAVALVLEEQHLGIPVVGRQRPAVMEDDGFSAAPVLVENLGVVGRGDEGHAKSPA